MIKAKKRLYPLIFPLLVAPCSLAASEPDHEHHEAHVHGEAALMIAMEDHSLEIEFMSPAMNIVGFEHQPKNSQQTQLVETAIAKLKQASTLFKLPSQAGCKIEAVEVSSPLAAPAKHEEHEEEDHSDFSGHYHYKCQDLAKLTRIDVELFKQFPATEAIEVQTISNLGQQKIDLSPGEITINF